MIRPSDLDIRARAILVAVLPTMVMALVLIAYFTSTRLSDLEAAHVQRGKALARQLAAASEYGVFSGNLDSLRKQANAILQEQDVVRVTVFSPLQEILADSARLPAQDSLPLGSRERKATLRFREKVTGPGVILDDAFLETGSNTSAPGEPHHGEVLVEMSRDSLRDEEARLLRTAIVMVAAILFASIILALRMSRGISGPIQRIASAVASFGQGSLTARVPAEGGKSLRMLALGVNEMADRLSASREDLERQIEAATRELKKKKEEAEQGNQAKTRFLAAASHDLRQPMHALGLFVAELGQKPHAPDTRRLVEQIAVSAETMENLLDSLLDISRLDAGVLDRQIKPFPLQPLLERIDVDYRREADSNGQRLRLRPTDAWVESDPLLLERILHNLISNALRYAPGGTVLLACRRRDRLVRIEVRDNGPGIAPEAQEAIFQEFIQLDNPERNRAKGLGLGLAIVRRLTDLLDHRLILRSRPGHGALFAIEVPRASPRTVIDGAPPPPAHALHGLHVLLVDDDPLALGSTASLLESWGCAVTTVSEPALLLHSLAGSPPPDIALCEYKVGKRSGLHLIRDLRNHFVKVIPAIILSSDTSTEALAEVQQEGLPLLHKPVRPGRLRALLQRKTQG